MDLELKQIATMKTDFPDKFGIPRQSGLSDTEGYLIFEPEFRNTDMVRGLEGYSHLWIIWGFSENYGRNWTPTVRPPRLGGNKRVGVFATRSPFRPNPIGLSLVAIKEIRTTCVDAPVIVVKGADLMNDTPVYDIKPYLPYTEAVPEARGGFSDLVKSDSLHVIDEAGAGNLLGDRGRKTLFEILAQDPRPHYQKDPERIYGMRYAQYEVKFKADGRNLYLLSIERYEE